LVAGCPEELMNERLFDSTGPERSAIAEYTQKFNTARLHPSLGQQNPASFAGCSRQLASKTTSESE
jgi:hypothetical protein